MRARPFRSPPLGKRPRAVAQSTGNNVAAPSHLHPRRTGERLSRSLVQQITLLWSRRWSTSGLAFVHATRCAVVSRRKNAVHADIRDTTVPQTEQPSSLPPAGGPLPSPAQRHLFELRHSSRHEAAARSRRQFGVNGQRALRRLQQCTHSRCVLRSLCLSCLRVVWPLFPRASVLAPIPWLAERRQCLPLCRVLNRI